MNSLRPEPVPAMPEGFQCIGEASGRAVGGNRAGWGTSVLIVAVVHGLVVLSAVLPTWQSVPMTESAPMRVRWLSPADAQKLAIVSSTQPTEVAQQVLHRSELEATGFGDGSSYDGQILLPQLTKHTLVHNPILQPIPLLPSRAAPDPSQAATADSQQPATNADSSVNATSPMTVNQALADRPVTPDAAQSVQQTTQGNTPPASAGSTATGPSGIQNGARQGLSYRIPPNIHYPADAVKSVREGTVVLRVHVNALGEPERVEIMASSGSSALDKAAQTAVENARFNPLLKEGKPVATETLIPFRFALH